MLLHLTAQHLDGVVPQEVLDQKGSWIFLIVLLGVTLIVRIVGMDLAGALLTGLMLVFAVIIVRDRMAELHKYNLVFGLLCFVNFFFDILPLLSMLGGRRMEEIEPVPAAGVPNGGKIDDHKSEQFKLTIRTYSFFDKSQGIVYNALSLSMLLSPICMLFGTYLSFKAHDSIMRNSPAMFEEDDLVGNLAQQNTAVQAAARINPNTAGASSTSGGPSSGVTYGGTSFEAFTGHGHRL